MDVCIASSCVENASFGTNMTAQKAERPGMKMKMLWKQQVAEVQVALGTGSGILRQKINRLVGKIKLII